jgi:hypothetical protein
MYTYTNTRTHTFLLIFVPSYHKLLIVTASTTLLRPQIIVSF